MAASKLSVSTFHHQRFPLTSLMAARQGTRVSVCLPARNEVRTIGPLLEAIMPLRDQGLVDQVAVVEDSIDGTAEAARARGAEVYAQRSLRPEAGPVLGKGDAMWRSLSILRGDIVVFLDADSERAGPHFVGGLLGPLLMNPGLQFVKAYYRRPFRAGGVTLPEGGGRVTELLARPLLEAFYPELAGVRQPLAGEIAVRRRLLERLPFVTGYGVDIALLLDAHALVGARGLAQVDLDVRQNDHQSLRELAPMAAAVLGAVNARLRREGRLTGPAGAGEAVERPPLAGLQRAA